MSLRKAINRKCRECIYDQRGPGTWRQQVSGCTSINCPLHPVRPMPTDNTAEPLNAPEIPENGQFDPIMNSGEVTQ